MSTIKVNSIESSTGGGVAARITSINGGQISNKNLIINGDLKIWARGTSTTTSGAYQADRFWVANQGSYDLDASAPDGFFRSIKTTYSSTDIAIGQPILLQLAGNPSPFVVGDKVTLSFYAKVDSGTETAMAHLEGRISRFNNTNKTVFPTASGNDADRNFTMTTSWQRFSFTFTVPTLHSSNTILHMEVNSVSRTAYFTGFQVEKGDVMSDFEFLPQSVVRNQCSYFFHTGEFVLLAFYNGGNFGGGLQNVYFPQPMRAVPSVTVTMGGGVGSVNTFAIAPKQASVTIWHGSSASTGNYRTLFYNADAEIA